MLNGDGLRVVLWVAGCTHCCKECHNPVTWDPDGGILFDESAKRELFDQLDKPYISGITFSGGDPLHSANRLDIRELMEEIKERCGGKGIICDDNISKVSIVGAGMQSNPGVASKMFEALAEANVNIQMISTSEIKISVLVKLSDADKAVNAIHDAFEL